MTSDQLPDDTGGDALQLTLDLRVYGQQMLGERAWRLFFAYGRVMSGPRVGRYVSGLPVGEARQLVDALMRGDQLPLHLMHRHRSGCYESSELRLGPNGLVMVFPDREEQA